MHHTRRRRTRHRRTRRTKGGNDENKKSMMGRVKTHLYNNGFKYGVGIGALAAYKAAPLISKIDELVHKEIGRPMKKDSRIRRVKDGMSIVWR